MLSAALALLTPTPRSSSYLLATFMARRNPLVCQYVENLSSAALEKYAEIIRDLVGRQHGVYALYRRDKLYYVGLATNLRSRLRGHLRDRHKGLWDRFSVYLTIDHRYLRELESLVIRIAQPKGNKQRGKFARSENLMLTLRRQLRDQQKAEWLELIGSQRNMSEEDGEGAGHASRRRSRPALAEYITRAISLRAIYKGKTYKARVLKNGTIRVGKRVFNTPTGAAKFAAGLRRVNGWVLWKYERAPGKWVRLREMRRR